MDALDLFQLGRRLTKLGEEAMRPFGGSPSRPGRRLVLIDALAFPDSSVGEIATRTGLPQSYVSGMVAKLRDLGILETRADPADRRRTLVKGSGSKPNAVVGFGAVRVDALLVEALGDSPPGSPLTGRRRQEGHSVGPQTERSSVAAPSDGPDARHRDQAWRRGLAGLD
jgi:hypothetical protein